MPEAAGKHRWLNPVLCLALLAMFAWVGLGAAHTVSTGKLGDFPHFYNAGVAVAIDENPYALSHEQTHERYAPGGGGYIYPPMLSVLFRPIAVLSPEAAAMVWVGLSTALIGVILWLAWTELRRRFRAGADTTIVLAALALAMALGIDKTKSQLLLGQTDTLVLLAFLLGLRWQGRSPILCGVALGFAANIKYLSLVFVPYLLLRRRWVEAGSAVTSAVGLALSTSLVFGWSRNVEYLGSALGGLTRMLGLTEPTGPVADIHQLTWIRSVSIPSALGRLEEQTGGGLAVVIGGSILAGLVALGLGWMLLHRHGVPLLRGRGPAWDDRTPRGPAVVALEWVGLIVASLAFSPQTTARHMFMLLVAWVLAAMLLLAQGPPVRRWPVVLGVGIAVAGMNLPPGGGTFEQALTAWRSIGGASWCVLAMYFLLLWTGLRWAAGLGPTEGGATPTG